MKYKILIHFLIVFLLVAINLKAQTLFSQYRLIYKKDGIMSMFLSNPTEKSYKYKIAFEDREMDKTGTLHAVPDGKTFSRSLLGYLRVFPRSVVIAPGSSQEVQIQLKTPDSLPDGEYRSFIAFSPSGDNTDDDRDSLNQGTQIALNIQMAASIPILYRKNPALGQITIDSVSLSSANDSIKLLHLCIRRDGNRSVYGKLNVISYNNGMPSTLFSSKANVVMYCEVPSLKLTIPINLKSADRTPEGKVSLNIIYVDNEDSRIKRQTVFAEKKVELTVPKAK